MTISKQTKTLLDNAQSVSAAAQSGGPELVRRLSELLGGSHSAFDAAALQAQIDGQRWYLTSRSQTLIEREEALAAELGDNPALREALGLALADVRGDIIQARELSSGLYEPSIVSGMGFVGTIPDDASSLLSYGANVAKGLRAQAGKPGRLGLVVDTTPLSDGLDESLARLKVAHQASVEDVREDQRARLLRDEAFADLRVAYRSAALIIEGYLRQAGLIALADRIRPTERRAQGLDAPAPQDDATPA